MHSARACLLALAFALAPPIAAQRTVRIVTQGQPLANVEVSFWSDTARLSLVHTSGDGVATLHDPSRVRVVVIARRLGFVPERRMLDGADTVVIAMTPSPTALPEIALASRVLTCPKVTSTDADSTWRTAAATYTPGGSGFRLEWSGGSTDETVTPEQRGYGDGSPLLAVGYGGVNPSSASMMMHVPPPYALYERHVSIGGEYWRWRYAPLQGIAAEHFLSASFHEHHTMQVLGRNGDATVVGFCPVQQREPDIRGELLIGDNGELRGARWFVLVPHDDEDAGGEATFVITEVRGKRYLVAIRGATWRRATKNLYNQERFERTSWKLQQ